MTIKNKLISVMVITVVSILVNIYIVNSMLSQSKELQNTKNHIFKLSESLQKLDKNSRDFLEHKDLSHEIMFEKNYNILVDRMRLFKKDLNSMDIDTKTAKKLEKEFLHTKENFESLVAVQKKLGLNSKEGLYKQLYLSVKKAEKEAKKLQNQDVFSMVLTLRNLEKTFMITHKKSI